jgi:cold shock CspA family protein
MAKRKGWIKYTDPEKGYGYIVSEDAKSAADAILFEQEDIESEMEDLLPGVEVVYEVEDSGARAQTQAPQAKQVRAT